MTVEKRKRAIEYLPDGSERQEKFQKRLEGIMKKAHELAVMTGNQVFLLMASESGSVHSYATAKFEPLLSPTKQCEFFKEQMKEAEIDTCQISESQSWSTQDIHHPDIAKTSYENVPIQFHQVEFKRSGTPIDELMQPKATRPQRSTSTPPAYSIPKPVPMHSHRPSPLHQAQRKNSFLEQPLQRPNRAMSFMDFESIPMIRVTSMPHLNQEPLDQNLNFMNIEQQLGNMNFGFDGMMDPNTIYSNIMQPMHQPIPLYPSQMMFPVQHDFQSQSGRQASMHHGVQSGMQNDFQPTMQPSRGVHPSIQQPMQQGIQPIQQSYMQQPMNYFQQLPEQSSSQPYQRLPFLETELDGTTPPSIPLNLKIHTNVPQAPPHLNSAVSNGSTLHDFKLPSPQDIGKPSIIP
jgi:hypothetical protein